MPNFTDSATIKSLEMLEPHGKEEEERAPSSADESNEYQQALEVIFESENPHRRKSSIVAAGRAGDSSACFIHTMLERRKDATRLDDEKIGQKDRPEDKSQDGTARSRMLTKKQLSDMVWGVRDVSKQLGSLRIRIHVQTIFILTKAHDETLIAYTREVARWLLSKDRGTMYTVYVENTMEHNKAFDAPALVAEEESYAGRLKYWDTDLCRRKPQLFDFVVTLGGDGTVLYASWLFQRVVPPVLSFAMGSLGFLTKFDYGSYPESLDSAFNDGVTVSLRLRFEGTVMRAQTAGDKSRDLIEELIGEESDDTRTHKPAGTYEILNDIVVDRGPNPTMSSIEVFGDNDHFTTVQADGVCVATPTGSTAYNLAAGGALSHPDNPVILLTAICAHTLSFRPIILPDTIVLRLGVPYDARTSSWASFDGRERVELKTGDYVTISASRFPFAYVLPQGPKSEDWVQGIRRTLQWNSRQRQKAFVD